MSKTQHTRGLSISAKLIIATSLLVAIALAATTFFGQQAISDVSSASVSAKQDAGERAIARESDLIVNSVATAVALPVASSAYSDIEPLLKAAIEEDQRRDRRLQWLLVTDAQGTMISKMAASGAAAPSDKAALDILQTRIKAKQSDSKIATSRALVADDKPTEWVYQAPISVGSASAAGSGVVGHLLMGVTTAGLYAELARNVADAKKMAADARTRVLIIAAAILLAGVILAFLWGSRLAKPVKALTRQAERIASGDLTQRVDASRSDELGVLATSFNHMSDRISTLLVEQAQKASMEREMSLARSMQASMLPSTALHAHGQMRVAGYCMPASSAGGDWWTIRKLANDRLLFVLGDATGHGIHSAMVAACARGAVEALGAIDERLLTPDQVLRAIDVAIRDVGDNSVLMTAFAALFDSNHGVLHYANAGQNFPYVVSYLANGTLGDAKIVAAAGNPLGDPAIKPEIRRGSLQLSPGDLFVCFSDGLVERANKAGKLFGDRRLRNALRGKNLSDKNMLAKVRDDVLASAETFSEGVTADDDITFVLCWYEPAEQRTLRGVA